MAKKSLVATVFSNYKYGGTHKLIMLLIADLSSSRGYADPSVKTIASMCGVSERQAQYVLKDLIESNYILIANNKSGGKAGMTRHYMINISTLTGAVFSTRHGCNGLHPTVYTRKIEQIFNAGKSPYPCG
jgi:hypothetical protein